MNGQGLFSRLTAVPRERRTKRLRPDEDWRSTGFRTTAPGVPLAKVARHPCAERQSCLPVSARSLPCPDPALAPSLADEARVPPEEIVSETNAPTIATATPTGETGRHDAVPAAGGRPTAAMPVRAAGCCRSRRVPGRRVGGHGRLTRGFGRKPVRGGFALLRLPRIDGPQRSIGVIVVPGSAAPSITPSRRKNTATTSARDLVVPASAARLSSPTTNDGPTPISHPWLSPS